MNDERTSNGHGRGALGEVARDVMDHLTMIARDEARIARLSTKRYLDHLRRDVAPKALFVVGAAVCAAIAALCGLVALFLAIVWAIGSIAWAFAIFAVLFVVATVVMAGFVKQPPRLERSEDIARRFPSVEARESMPEHALARQDTPEAHRAITEEAQREAHDEERRVERWEIAPHPSEPQEPARPQVR